MHRKRMKQPTNKELRDAQDAVDNFNQWDLLGHNTKLLQDGETYQKRLSDTLRVQFTINEDGVKEIVDVFHKENHKQK